MDDNQAVSADLSTIEMQSELLLLHNKLHAAEEKIMQLELALLQSRDFSIGASAELGETRAEYFAITEKLKDANTHIKNHRVHITRLEEALGESDRAKVLHTARSAELDRVYNSTSWRIGRFIMIPIRILRKISS